MTTARPTFTQAELADIALALEDYGLQVGSTETARINKLLEKVAYLQKGKLSMRSRPGKKPKVAAPVRRNPLASRAGIKKKSR